jgi:hypothetical protein
MKTPEKQQRKFMKLNQKEFFQEFQFWLEENERRINIFTNYYETPAKNSDYLWKELKKYPRKDDICFFCKKHTLDLFFLDHGDFWACLDCYDKYSKLKELNQAIKWELSENERKFPAGWHCTDQCESKSELDCCNSCHCSKCPKDKVYRKKLARFRIKEGKVSDYDRLIIKEELTKK